MQDELVILDLPRENKIPELFAALAVDKNGNEGIISKDGKPLVWSSVENTHMIIGSLLPRLVEASPSNTFIVVKFTNREILKEYK